MAADYSRIHRLLKIMTLVQGDPSWTVARLALECGKTERTVYRDIKMLIAAGIPIHFDDETKAYSIQRNFFMKLLELTLDESLALLALAKYIGQNEQVPFTKPAVQAMAKVRNQLPLKIQKSLDDLDQHMAVALAKAGPHDGCKDVYDRVQESISRRLALKCRYESTSGANKPSESFLLKPYLLFFSQRAWYVVGLHCTKDEIRTFKLNRFVQLQLTDSPYEIPTTFSLEKHLGNAWRMIRGRATYNVEIWFDSSFAQTICDTTWHKTQEIEEHDDGSATFRCKVDGLDEILWWVLSMGPHATVKSPPELAQRVRELATQTAALYDNVTAKTSKKAS